MNGAKGLRWTSLVGFLGPCCIFLAADGGAFVEQTEQIAHNIVNPALVAQQVAAAFDLGRAFRLEGAEGFLQLLINGDPLAVYRVAAQEFTDLRRNGGIVIGQVIVKVNQPIRGDGRDRHRA